MLVKLEIGGIRLRTSTFRKYSSIVVIVPNVQLKSLQAPQIVAIRSIYVHSNIGP
jgi:hypothetical protein